MTNFTCGDDLVTVCHIEVTATPALVTLALAARAAAQLSVVYYPLDTGGERRKLWASAQIDVVNGVRALKLRLCRLRPATTYEVQAFTWIETESNATRGHSATRPARAFAPTTFATVGSGFDWHGPQGEFALASQGDASWGVVSLAHATDDGGWTGLVMMDAAGFLVWYREFDVADGWLSWDQFPETHDLAVLRLQGSGGDLCSAKADCSSLVVVDADGAVQQSLHQRCYGDATNYNALHHEAKVWNETVVLSLLAKPDYYPGVELSYVDGKTVRPGYLLTDKLVQWNILTDELSTLVDFADAGVTPREIDMVSNASNTFEVVEMRCSGGSDPVEAVEWSGASSVAVGVDSNFLVTFKNLNAVVSVGRGAGDIQWILSSSIGSDYAFADPVHARFYNPHSVHQGPDGNVLLVDDGDMRPNCTVSRADPARERCYSRAVEYRLDADTKLAHLVWEFEFPLARTPTNRTAAARGETNSLAEIELEDYYVAAGGSVARLDNGNYIVAFTQIDDVYGETAWRNATRVFEVHADGSVNSQVILPAAWHHFASGAWRAVTLDSVCGESEVCPAQIAADAELAVGLCDSSFSAGDDFDDDQGGVIADSSGAHDDDDVGADDADDDAAAAASSTTWERGDGNDDDCASKLHKWKCREANEGGSGDDDDASQASTARAGDDDDADDQPWKVVASDDVDDQTGWGHGRATHGSGPDVPDSPR